MFRKSLLTLFLGFSLCFPTFAQEATEEAQPVEIVAEDTASLGTLPDPSPTEEAASDDLSETIFFLPFATALIALLTAIAKQIVPYPANKIKLVLGFLIWVAYAIAKEFFGAGAQFETVIGSTTELLSSFLGFVGSAGLSSLLYRTAKAEEIPLLGRDRPRD